MESNHRHRVFSPALYQLSYYRKHGHDIHVVTIAHQDGFEPPTGGFGGRCSDRTELLMRCAQGRDRTDDLVFGRHLLYLLSYLRLWDMMESNHRG